MDNIVDKIAESRDKLLSQNMTPKHLYLGRIEFMDLRHSSDLRVQPVNPEQSYYFMGFKVYEVNADNHYVVTGE